MGAFFIMYRLSIGYYQHKSQLLLSIYKRPVNTKSQFIIGKNQTLLSKLKAHTQKKAPHMGLFECLIRLLVRRFSDYRG